MALTAPIATRNAKASAALDPADGGVFRVYSGSRPAVDSAATGTLLAEFDLADPAFTAPSSGARSIPDPIDTVGLAAGDAGYFRMLDASAGTVYDGSVGIEGSGADAILSTLTVSVGLIMTLQSITITEP